MAVKQEKTVSGDQEIQSAQYDFPYHYIPSSRNKLYLSRHWAFASSYFAALNLVTAELRPHQNEVGASWTHIDIGTGDGALIYFLSQRWGIPASQLNGVDIDERAIAWARMFSPHSELICGDISEINMKFDATTLVEVLEHIPPTEVPDFVGKVASLLRPGGLLVLTVPSTEKELANKHFQHFDFTSIRSVVQPHFENIDIFGFEKSSVISRLVELLRNNPIARVDAPFLNKRAVAQYARRQKTLSGCGRIFLTARKPFEE